jgi:TolB-like protein/Tfp pilus assembly protein PilF
VGRIGQFIQDAGRRRVLSNAALYIVAAWVVIQVADLAIDAGVLRWPLRNVFVAAFLGFPIALILSWFYDVTRRGIVRTPPRDADSSFDESLNKRDYLLIASLAAVWVVGNVFVYTPTAVDKSIAILPFENPGHDPDNAMFAFGIRVDLQTQLQNLHDLKIIARESSDRIDSDMSLPEIGLKLGAAYIMRGSVERVLDRVRVNVILLDAEKEQQTWAGSYDRELTATNWFDIRNEISAVITDTLQAELSPAEQERLETVPTQNLAALEAYFHGKQRMATRATKALAEAVGYFQQAVELDPEFALAWVGLADSLQLRMAYAALPEDVERPKVQAAINLALELDERLGEAYASLGLVQWGRNELADAEVAYKRALELNPNYATAHHWYAIFLSSTGRSEEGLARIRKARELDPLSSIINYQFARELEELGQFDEALAQYKRINEFDPAFVNAYWMISEHHRSVSGQLDQAAVWVRKGIAVDAGNPSALAVIGWIYLELGDERNAQDWIKLSLEQGSESYWPNATMEYLHLYRGEEAQALDAARTVLTLDPTSWIELAYVGNHDLQAGRFAEARARYERGYPALLSEDPPKIDDTNHGAAIDLAYFLSKTGEQERAELLLDRSLAFIQTIPRLGFWSGHWISDVRIYALQGKTEQALAGLRQAIDEGWRIYWWYYLEHDPILASIRDEPEFQAMLEEIKADMATQLQRVRAMEASGNIGPIPDIN